MVENELWDFFLFYLSFLPFLPLFFFLFFSLCLFFSLLYFRPKRKLQGSSQGPEATTPSKTKRGRQTRRQQRTQGKEDGIRRQRRRVRKKFKEGRRVETEDTWECLFPIRRVVRVEVQRRCLDVSLLKSFDSRHTNQHTLTLKRSECSRPKQTKEQMRSPSR